MTDILFTNNQKFLHMKRFTFLSLLVLLCVAVGRAQTLSQLSPDEITAGKRIVLRGAAVNNIFYFNGAEANDGFLASNKVYVVEEAATPGKIVLKNEETGAYVAKPTAQLQIRTKWPPPRTKPVLPSF